jgi:hypothetical protein
LEVPLKSLSSLSAKLCALAVACAIVVGAVLAAVGVQALGAGAEDANARQADAAGIAAHTLAHSAVLTGEGLRDRLAAAAADAPSRAAAGRSVALLAPTEGAVVVDARGRTADGTRVGLADLPIGGATTTVARVSGADLSALGLAAGAAERDTPQDRPSGRSSAVDDGLAVVASVPTRGGGRLIGVRVLNGDAALVDDNSRLMGTGGITTLFLGDVRVATSARDAAGGRLTGTTMEPKVRDTVFRAGREYTGVASVAGTPYVGHYDPIRDPAGTVVGAWYSGYPRGTIDASAATARQRILIAAFVLIVIVGFSAAAVIQMLLGPSAARRRGTTSFKGRRPGAPAGTWVRRRGSGPRVARAAARRSAAAPQPSSGGPGRRGGPVVEFLGDAAGKRS